MDLNDHRLARHALAMRMPGRLPRDGSLPPRFAYLRTSQIGGVCLEALWELRRPIAPNLSRIDWDALLTCLNRSDIVLVSEMLLSLAAMRRADSDVVEKCISMLATYDSHPDIQSASALALGSQREAIAPQSAAMITATDELLKLLRSECKRVVLSALVALIQLAPILGVAGIRQLMGVLRRGFKTCDNVLVTHTARALRATCESLKDEAKKYFEWGVIPFCRRAATGVLR